MALTEGDKAQVMEICREIIVQVVPMLIEAHRESCPIGKFVETWKQRLIGVGILAFVIAAGSSAGTALILNSLL